MCSTGCCACAKLGGDFTHRDSAEMLGDREFGSSRGAVSCKARKDAGSRGAGAERAFPLCVQYVGLNLLMFEMFW